MRNTMSAAFSIFVMTTAISLSIHQQQQFAVVEKIDPTPSPMIKQRIEATALTENRYLTEGELTQIDVTRLHQPARLSTEKGVKAQLSNPALSVDTQAMQEKISPVKDWLKPTKFEVTAPQTQAQQAALVTASLP